MYKKSYYIRAPGCSIQTFEKIQIIIMKYDARAQSFKLKIILVSANNTNFTYSLHWNVAVCMYVRMAVRENLFLTS